MDQSLKIKVESNVKELQELINKFNEGNISIGEMTRLKKLLTAEARQNVNALNLESDTAKKYTSALAQVNESQKNLRLVTKAGHEEYFKAGLEARQLMLANLKLDGALGQVSNALGNSVGAALGFKQALVPLGISLGGVGIGIAAAVAVIPSLISMFGESAEAAKKSAKEIADLNSELDELLIKSGKITSEGAINLYTQQAEAMRSQVKALESRFTSDQLKAISAGRYAGMFAPDAEEHAKKILQLRIDILKKEEQIKDITEAIAEKNYKKMVEVIDSMDQSMENHSKNEKARADKLKQSYEDRLNIARLQFEIDPKNLDNLVKELAYVQSVTKDRAEQLRIHKELMRIQNIIQVDFEERANKRMGMQGSRMVAGGGAGEKPQLVAKTFSEALKEADAFNSAFMSGISTIAGEISNKIGNAFASVFGGAHTLLGGFVSAFMTALSNIASQILVSGILNSIFPTLGLLGGFKLFASGGWIPEPVVGVGKSGQRYMFAERGPEYVIANDQLQGARQNNMALSMKPVFNIFNKIDHRGLATSVEIGKRQLSLSTM